MLTFELPFSPYTCIQGGTAGYTLRISNIKQPALQITKMEEKSKTHKSARSNNYARPHSISKGLNGVSFSFQHFRPALTHHQLASSAHNLCLPNRPTQKPPPPRNVSCSRSSVLPFSWGPSAAAPTENHRSASWELGLPGLAICSFLRALELVIASSPKSCGGARI